MRCIKVDTFIEDLNLFACLGAHEEFEDEIKKIGSGQDGCFTSLMLRWATISYPIANACAIPEGTNNAGFGM